MNIYNVIILDESGSMSPLYNETLCSVNEVLCGIRRDQQNYPDQRHYVTIVTFEGRGMEGVKTRRDRVPIDIIKDFTKEDYRPGGCTPLFDAMGKTLSELEGRIFPDDKVLATIITDGYENASQSYSREDIRALTDSLREKGWTLSYLGANQDAVEVARDLNIPNSFKFEATEDGLRTTASKMNFAHTKACKCLHFGNLDYMGELYADYEDEPNDSK